MRPLTIALAIAALAATPAAAAAQLRVGARAGVNRANIEAETGQQSAESKLGLIGGAYVEGGLFGRFGWQVGAQYSQKGIRELFMVQGNQLELELGVDYVEVPIMVQYLAQARGPVALVLYGGGAPAFEVRCESTVSLRSESFTVACGETDPDAGFAVDPVKSFDLTAILGASLTAILGSVQISGEAFYGIGLIPFVDEDDEAEADLEHRVTSFTLGVSIPLGGGGPPDLLDIEP